jgi:predicted GNAT superfamily acetyltransferase
VGDALYADLLQAAAALGAPLIALELDVEPPNLASARFHARHGFREVGRQAVQGGKKVVSLQTRPVP